MASTEASGPVNGNYAPQGYENSYATGASNFTPSQQPTATQAQQAPASEIPKDEVGWYFVEQYYTTLSKSPERLYLFYNKRSQYVSGVEEEKVSVCVGQKAINERIKDLDFKDTKVRVTNVDSQGSDANIVIQVIGEISNQGQPHKRFAQTFVLAEQTNGYFVLNDIFRYLAEEPEEEEELQQEPNAAANGVQEPPHTAAVPADQVASQADETAAHEEDLNKVDEKLAEVEQEEPAVEEAAPAAQEPQEEVHAPHTGDATADATEAATEPEPSAKEVEAEKPKASPAPSASKAAPVAMPAGPPKPAAPRTWASLAASANKVATPVIAAPAAQQVPSQPKAAAAAQPAAAAPAASQAPAPARDQSPSATQGEAAGWQTATGHKKEQSRAQNQGPAPDADQKRAYIKNVYSQVEEGALRTLLTKFGEIEYLDISRAKNCAFVDFKTPAGFQAAVAANPHNVNDVEIKVEERRQRPEQFRGGFQRGGAPRGRGGAGGQGPRGGFTPRGRGGPGRGGRGAPQDA